MTHQEQFSSSVENWSEISDFPGYSVSDWGRVVNDRNGKLATISINTKNLCIVGLMRDRVQHKRSVPLLVARQFVPFYRDREEFDTPINLNGDRTDNRGVNLMWRPLWFARKYHAQFLDDHGTFEEPVEDVETGELFKCTMHAATVHGLLDSEIWLSMMNNTYVWPTGQVFRKAL